MTAIAEVTGRPQMDDRRCTAGPLQIWLPITLLAVTEILAALAVYRLVSSGLSWRAMLLSYGLTNAWLGATFAPFGAAVAYRRPRLVIGWLFCAFGALYCASAFGIAVETYDFVHSHASHVNVGIEFVGLNAWTPAVAFCFPLILLLFPDGRFASRAIRRVAIPACFVGAVWVVSWALDTATVVTVHGDTARVVSRTETVSNVGMLVVFVLSAVVLIRLRRLATGRARSQLTWLVAGATVAVGLFLPTGWGITSYWATLMLIGVPLFPVACAVAILRHQLFDLDVAINRTLVFLTLSGGLLGLYLAVVAIARAIVGGRADFGGALAAAVLVTVVFAPARAGIQRLIDRLMFGTRADPSQTLTTLAASLESSPDDGLLAALTSMCESLRLPTAVIRLDDRTIGSGDPESEPEAFPLRFRQQIVGELLVWPRRGQRSLDPGDIEVLRIVAGPLASAAYSAHLTDQLHQSRLQILDTREAERDRLHRDLHDGLGPALTAVALKADAAGNVMVSDHDRAKALLTQIAGDTRAVIADVRRISHGLRPPNLDAHGLLRALRLEAGRFTSRLDGSTLSTTADLPATLPRLTDEVVSAAYHISIEALTNVARHSSASRVRVAIAVDDVLVLTITDNGETQSAAWADGFGVASMRRRALDCGGAFAAGPTPLGGEVRAELPVAGGSRK